MKKIIAVLPRQAALDLSRVRDKRQKLVSDLANYGLARDWLDQAGFYPMEFYPLFTPPRVLIFHSTMNQRPSESAEHGAENKVKTVEEYFRKRNFLCVVREDLTAEEIFSSISTAQSNAHLSSLVVFLIGEGEKEVMKVQGEPGYVTTQEIITHMCCHTNTNGKPKVGTLNASSIIVSVGQISLHTRDK